MQTKGKPCEAVRAGEKRKNMKKKQIVCLLIMLLCISFNEGHAQEQKQHQTAYEKKKSELVLEAWAKFGQDGARYVSSELDKTDEEVYEGVKGVDMAAVLLGRYTNGMQSLKWYAKELKKIEKLKTSVDLGRDKEKKEKKAKEEAQKKEKQEQEVYAKTDIGYIKKNIKSAFEQWNQKGEFEKDADYTNRLQSQSKKAFEDICLDKIKDRIKNKDSYHWEKELSAYNSESEFFTISFKINDLSWQSNINTPIAQAQNFKNDWSDLRFKIDDYDWCFVYNNLCPILVTLGTYNEKSKYKFPVSLQNQSEILYVYDELEIENPYLSGYTYKYSNAKAIAEQQEREKQRLDSLELTTFNKRLDSIFNDYNRKLLKNGYNQNRILLKGYNKITNGEDRASSFKGSVSSMKSEFNYLIDYTFQYERSHEYNQKGGLVFSTEREFEAFYTQGKDIYQAEVEKRRILNYLSIYSEFIESMDFQKEAKETIGSVLMLSNYGTNYTQINENRKMIFSKIKESENKLFYSQVIDFVIETNKGLNKEWTKNGQYFESKTVFYNAFLSDDYKMILKNNKKK